MHIYRQGCEELGEALLLSTRVVGADYKYTELVFESHSFQKMENGLGELFFSSSGNVTENNVLKVKSVLYYIVYFFNI